MEPTTLEASPPQKALGPTACLAAVEGVRGVFELEPGVPLSIGRSRSSAIQVDDAAVSRLHATLTWDGAESVTVHDHESRNGTSVRGARIHGDAVARAGDTIGVGPGRFVVLIARTSSGGAAVGTSMARALSLADRAAACDLPVLLLGETGAGKEVLARRIHERSARGGGPFVAVNCGSIPETLAESLLFGHEKGAFTGAAGQKPGVFESARGGTVFLDEIGELPLAHQARLLRVLEQKEIVRVGATRPTPIDARVVCATHRDLDRAARDGRFRRDLLFRIDVLRIAIPPLRERGDELPALCASLLRELGSTATLDEDALALLRAEPFPGNVRELRNVLARATLGGPTRIDRAAIAEALPDREGRHTARGAALRGQVASAERDAIEAALAATGGNQTHAAKRLGISRRALLYKMERHGLSRPRAASRGEPR